MEQPPSTEKTSPQKGDVILVGATGKLEIEGIIAEGRTSTIVSALDHENGGRKVAVKIARGSDLESVERFKRAARGMAKLKSPFAVKVLGVGATQDGAPCMTMEYLEGRTLAQKVLQSGPLPVGEATKWMRQVCDALAEAHAHKLLHRDLDAENVFLAMPPLGTAGEPSVRVLDFGLAPVWRLGKGDGRLRPGDVAGTSFAMAPELARGSDLDERVDVWGVGACLFRLLTNRHPFNARNLAELCTRILAERAPDLAKVRPDVPPALAAVVKRCLEREPSDRFRSIRELGAALEATEDEAPLTPLVPTEKVTAMELRAIEQGAMTPAFLPAAAPVEDPERVTDPGPPSPNSDQDETVIHRREALGAVTAASADGLDGDIGAPTPHTVRVVPAFEAIAQRLEPPKPKTRTDPPPPRKLVGPLPPPTPPPGPFLRGAIEVIPEDGPSTQPLGRLSPFAELPKPAPVDVEPPSEDHDHTIKPVLLGTPPAPAPLPRPSPTMMSQETVQGPAPALPRPSPVVMNAETLPRPSPVVMNAETLPRPSPVVMNAETLPRGMEPPPAPLVFQAPPRTLELPVPAPSARPPAPAPLDPSPPARAEAAPPVEPEKPRSRALVVLVFALGIAASIAIGLVAARARLSADPSGSEDAGRGSTVEGSARAPQASAPASVAPAPASEELDASAEPEAPSPAEGASASPSAAASHRRPRRLPPPPPATSAAPVKSGNVYDPSSYDPK